MRPVRRVVGLGIRLGTALPLALLRAGIRRSMPPSPTDQLPEGRLVELTGRGETFVIDVPGPTPDAPVLLLLHGLASTAALNWFPVLHHLSAHYRVVMFDQRWHGRGIVSEHFRLDDCADDAAALLDELGIDQAIVGGYSMGGALAQVIWHRHPDRVAGLVLCSTAMSWKHNLGERLFFPSLRAVNDVTLRRVGRGHVHRRRAGIPLLPGIDLADLHEWTRTEIRSVSGWSMLEVLGELGSFSSAGWMGTVSVPCAVVITGNDRAIAPVRQRALAAAIPDARVFEAPGGHTSLFFDVPRWSPVFLEAVGWVAAGVPVSAEAQAR